MSPGHSVLGLGLEKHVGDAEVVVAAEFEKSLPVLVHLPDAMVTQTQRP